MMSKEIMQSGQSNIGLRLDPRTKLLLMLTISIFVLGEAGGGVIAWVRPALSAVPCLLLICSGRFTAALFYAFMYIGCYMLQWVLLPVTTGTANFLNLIACGLFCRFLPGFMPGYYLVRTTTASEFVAGMHRIHIQKTGSGRKSMGKVRA